MYLVSLYSTVKDCFKTASPNLNAGNLRDKAEGSDDFCFWEKDNFDW